jgi:hypothetical protein
MTSKNFEEGVEGIVFSEEDVTNLGFSSFKTPENLFILKLGDQVYECEDSSMGYVVRACYWIGGKR